MTLHASSFSAAYTIDHHHQITRTEVSDQDPRGIIWLYEPPSLKADYVIAADPTVGITGWHRALRTRDDRRTDNAAIQVLRVGKPGSPDVQVAEFAAPIDPYDLAVYINVLGRLYGGRHEDGQALCIIEVYPGPGLPTQRTLLEKYGYSHLFIWKYLDERGLRSTGSLGWTSSPKAVRDLWIHGIRWGCSETGVILYSTWLADELYDCVMDLQRMRGAAIYGRHDDRVMALFLAGWAAHEWSGQVETDPTSSVENSRRQTDWQRSDLSYREMMELWESSLEEMLEGSAEL